MKDLFTFLFLSIFCLVGRAQSLPEKCHAYLPKALCKSYIYEYDIENIAKNNYGQNGCTNKYWTVYSDRCNNIVYSKPTLTSRKVAKLDFCQKVRIAKIEKGFALVYRENKPGALTYPQISRDVKCFGWVPMENLLLWPTCIKNRFGIPRKALIVSNLDIPNRDGRASFTPVPEELNDSNGFATRNGEFLYIIKTYGEGDETRYLLARSNNIEMFCFGYPLYGWVSKGTFVEWSQRACIEPNWDLDDVEYFQKKGEKAYVYVDEAMTKKGLSWSFGRKNNERQTSTQYRMSPKAVRFPIIDNDNNPTDSYKVVAFCDSIGESGVSFDKMKLSFTGYAKKTDGSGHEYWNIVLFMSSEELMELIMYLEPLKMAAKVNTSTFTIGDRANYVKAVSAFVSCMTEIPTEEIEQMSTDDLSRIISGLYVSTPMLKGDFLGKHYTFSDIMNPQVCPDENFRLILKSVSMKIENLSAIPKSAYYKYSFKDNGVRYYWIPFDMIP